MPVKTFLFNQGMNNVADRSMLSDGELTLATGAYYKPGDTTRIWKLAGRSVFATLGSGSRVDNIALCQFDTASEDLLVGLVSSEGTLVKSSLTTVTSGTLTTLTSGLSTLGTVLSWVHYDDVWFFGNARDRNLALEPGGSLRPMGMQAVTEQPSGVASAGTTVKRPSTFAANYWYDKANAGDSDQDTFAYAVASSWLVAPDNFNIGGFAANTDTDRYIVVRFSVGQASTDDPTQLAQTVSGKFDFQFTVQIDVSGGGYNTIYTQRCTEAIHTGVVSVPLADAVDTANLSIRIKWEDNASSVLFKSLGTCRIYDVRVTDAGVSGDFTPKTGFYYAYAEVDSTAKPVELESVYSATPLITFATGNAVVLTLPTTQVNANADSYIIYRTHDGGLIPGDLRKIGGGPIGEATFLDDFSYDKDTPGGKAPPYLKVQITESLANYYPQNSPPPALRNMVEYQNFIVGLSDTAPRKLYYSFPAMPEYWPELYVITDFPLQEHDQLKALAVAGDLLIVGAQEAIIVINGLPEVEAQAYASAYMTALKGAPGCVGSHAMTAYSLGGEPRVAWISHFGVYETNGHQVWELTHDFDFESAAPGDQSRAAIYWDKQDQLMYVCYDSDGDGYNDQFITLHMSPEHRKKGGNPKVTGPHYGKIGNIVGGQIQADGKYHMYSACSAANGKIFNEKVGGTDESDAYNTSSDLPFDVRSGRIYSEQLMDWAVDFPTVRHLNWGAGQVAITWTVGFDDINETSSVVNTLTMGSQKSTKFAVSRMGEWHEWKFVHTGAGTGGALVHMQAEIVPMGESGDTQDS